MDEKATGGAVDDAALDRVAGGAAPEPAAATCPECRNPVPRSAFTGAYSFVCPTCGVRVERGLICKGEAV